MGYLTVPHILITTFMCVVESIVLFLYLEVRLRMQASGTCFRRLLSLNDIPAIAALPKYLAIFLEH